MEARCSANYEIFAADLEVPSTAVQRWRDVAAPVSCERPETLRATAGL